MIQHIFKHAKHAKHLGSIHNYYANNPQKIGEHGAHAIRIGKLAWTHGPRAAKHTANFLSKAAVRGFKLFNS